MTLAFLSFIFFLTANVFANDDLNTLSITGDISFDQKELNGSFNYVVRNDGFSPKNDWTFFIHPSVDILSVSQDGRQARLETTQGLNYRVVTVKFYNILSNMGRTTVNIKFSLKPQNQSPRMTVSSNFVFLDAREFWFPYPVKDLEADYEITVKTPSDLNSAMGGKLTHNARIVDTKISTWKNEIKNISPSMSLVISENPMSSQSGINIYSDNEKFKEVILQDFTPFWESVKKNYKFFPLSQIQIVPMDIAISHYSNHHIEGEFLGNLFLVNKSKI